MRRGIEVDIPTVYLSNFKNVGLSGGHVLHLVGRSPTDHLVDGRLRGRSADHTVIRGLVETWKLGVLALHHLQAAMKSTRRKQSNIKCR